MNPNIICLMGPTASGKTQLAVDLSRNLSIEIISVDSALIYRQMNIGTAKPADLLLKTVPHHLIDIRDPTQSYSAAEFCADAGQCIHEIHARGNTPVLVGGTMLYYRSLWEGLAPLPPADALVRAQIDARAAKFGWQTLHDELSRIDPPSALRIHPNDPQRLQRALEVFYITGQTISQFFEQTNVTPPPYNILKLALFPSDRAILHQRIEQRFDAMLKEGFLDEVKMLRERGDLHLDLPSIRTVGYRQAWLHLDGLYDAETMREKAIIATRQLAKRQLTWLRSFEAVEFLDSDSPTLAKEALYHINDFLSRKKIECGQIID
ncbi:MAG: tRNA (adenosine(37)-N6)-dimethylallyltransferase MiaA [Legionellales bacterium]|nr:tRNA (adenosine(37)-N6)-dimethylallyltransferase MiaA [Legionellales bacterium]